MRLALICFALFLVIALPTVAALPEGVLDRIDALHNEDRHEEVLQELSRLEDAASGAAEQAEILWRRARARFSQIDLALYAEEMGEDEALALLEEVQTEANRAVSLGESDPSAEAYFWRGAARAKRGELQGVLNALFMADDLQSDLALSVRTDPLYSNPYYVGGQLYHRVPGFPISFGDDAVAVSLSRKAVDLHNAAREAGELSVRYWDYYVKLAEHLKARNWSERRRSRHRERISSDYEGEADPFEQAKRYEAVADLPGRSDRQEARELLEMVVSGLEAKDDLTLRNRRTLEDARELID